MTPSFPQLCTGINRVVLTARLLCLCALIAGCQDRAPNGEVIAVVNGEEVTIPELNEEARARGLVVGSDVALRNALVRDIVDRKLLIQAAAKEKLDRTPEYLLSSRRASELVLAQQLVAATSQNIAAPSAEQLQAMIAANPQAFDDRALAIVEYIIVPPALEKQVGALAGARSLDQLQSIVAATRPATSDASETWDTASLAPAIARQLTSPEARTSFVLVRQADRLMAVHVLSLTPVPTSAANRLPYARALAMAQSNQQTVQALIGRARSSARVDYQPGFGPAPR